MFFDHHGNLPRRPLFLGLGSAMILALASCSSPPVELRPPAADPIELRIENHSAGVIDVIHTKPCGADNSLYKPQMNAIKPNERIMLHIYEECVDLVALDGFGNVMDELPSLRMNSNITWKIH